jgi:hypothetical protein
LYSSWMLGWRLVSDCFHLLQQDIWRQIQDLTKPTLAQFEQRILKDYKADLKQRWAWSPIPSLWLRQADVAMKNTIATCKFDRPHSTASLPSSRRCERPRLTRVFGCRLFWIRSQETLTLWRTMRITFGRDDAGEDGNNCGFAFCEFCCSERMSCLSKGSFPTPPSFTPTFHFC